MVAAFVRRDLGQHWGQHRMQPTPESGITAATLLPVITLVIGAVLTALFQYFSDLRSDQREANSRREQRRDAAKLRRIEFQRATLLGLQDRVAELIRAYGKGHVADEAMFKQTGRWRTHLYPEGVSNEIFDVQREVTKLYVRVRDESVRRDVSTVIEAGVRAGLANDRDTAEREIMSAGTVTGRINQRIGELLRTLDDEEDALIGK